MKVARLSRAFTPVILEDLARRVVSGGARNAAARMRACSAHVEARNRRAVIAVPKHGAGREQLVERKRPVHDVAARETEGALEIQGTHDLAPQDRSLEAGRIA